MKDMSFTTVSFSIKLGFLLQALYAHIMSL